MQLLIGVEEPHGTATIRRVNHGIYAVSLDVGARFQTSACV